VPALQARSPELKTKYLESIQKKKDILHTGRKIKNYNRFARNYASQQIVEGCLQNIEDKKEGNFD
jgi:hypothetical protein